MRTLRCTRIATLALLALTLAVTTAGAAPVRQLMQVTGYVIDADLDPAAHTLTATVTVTITALEDLNTVTFELNNGLQITRLVDAQQQTLSPERLTTNSTVRVPLATPLAKGATTSLTFDYKGALVGSDTSPVTGMSRSCRVGAFPRGSIGGGAQLVSLELGGLLADLVVVFAGIGGFCAIR